MQYDDHVLQWKHWMYVWVVLLQKEHRCAIGINRRK